MSGLRRMAALGPTVLSMISMRYVIGLASAALAAIAFLSMRAGQPNEVATAFRVGWLLWTAALCGMCEDGGEWRELVSPTSILRRYGLRVAWAGVWSAAVGAALTVVLVWAGSVPVGVRRLVGEAIALFLIAAGVSGLTWRRAPAGLVAAISIVPIALVLLSAQLTPGEVALWPAPESTVYRGWPWLWLLLGAVLVAGAALSLKSTWPKKKEAM